MFNWWLSIETFLYELAKKYHDKDLVVYYTFADEKQLNRLRKYVRCEQYEKGKKVVCKKAFFNFNVDMIDDVDAEEYILVIHGNYNEMKVKPPYHKKITRVIAVSQDSADAYTNLTAIPCEVCYNPISIKKDERLFVIASRLNDKVKGGNLIQTLIPYLDKWSWNLGIRYTMLIFTNDFSDCKVSSANVITMPPNIYIRPYLEKADYVLQLSSAEGYCYTVNEALMYGTKVVITPLKIYEELGISEKMALYLELDGSNADTIAKQMLLCEPKKIDYIPPSDRWDELLSDYKESEENMKKIRGLYYPDYYDTYEQKHIGKGQEYTTTDERAELIVSKGLAEYVTETEKADVTYDEKPEKETKAEPKKAKKTNGKKAAR